MRRIADKPKLFKKKFGAPSAPNFFVGNKQQISSRFGLAVRGRRERLGMTQTNLAKAAGLNRSYLSRLEHGLANISLERADRIAKALDCNLYDLLR